MFCGTGAETCSTDHGLTEKQSKDCLADPARLWRGLTVATDLQGNRVWSRQDNLGPIEQGYTDDKGNLHYLTAGIYSFGTGVFT